MRFRRQKLHRKAVKFYTTCFGFREPFKVLCDGTFIHHLLVNGLSPADKALEGLLGAPVKLFATRCVVGELKALHIQQKKKKTSSDGETEAFSETLQAVYNLSTARCDHEQRQAAHKCIIEVIGEKNTEHFFLATQDSDLRRRFHEVPGVPLIFGLRNALFVEPPSTKQREFVRLTEESRFHMTKLEHKLLDHRIKTLLADKEAEETSGVTEGLEDQDLDRLMKAKKNSRRAMSVREKVEFKRKKAKGPNPLSCKKKKKNESPCRLAEKGSKDGVSEGSARRKRKRKRSRKGKTIPETNGQG